MTKLTQIIQILSKKMAPKSNGIPKTFPKSRVPVHYILDYFKEGYSISDFQSSYPWIKRKDILSVLNHLRKHFLLYKT